MANWTRRRFLGATAGLAALPLSETAAAPKIPRRRLGKTGVQVSILGLGCGSQFLRACGTTDAEANAVEILNTAIDGGINYLDCAASYRNATHASEKLLGLVVPERLKQVFVTSKTQKRKRDEALAEVEQSLKNMRVDSLDLIQIHLIQPDEDLDFLLSKEGVYPALLELKRQRVVRHVGITGHLAAVNMRTLIERMPELDTVLLPVNPYKDSRHYLPAKNDADPNGHFEQLVLPAARKRGLGIIAMKVFAQGQLVGSGPGQASGATLLRYAMSEPGVAVAIAGPGSLDYLKQNLQTAQQFKPLTGGELKQLAMHVSDVSRRLAYHEPEYQDGWAI